MMCILFNETGTYDVHSGLNTKVLERSIKHMAHAMGKGGLMHHHGPWYQATNSMDTWIHIIYWLSTTDLIMWYTFPFTRKKLDNSERFRPRSRRLTWAEIFRKCIMIPLYQARLVYWLPLLLNKTLQIPDVFSHCHFSSVYNFRRN